MWNMTYDENTLYVVGVDPGETTGIAVIGVPRGSIYAQEPGAVFHLEAHETAGSVTSQVNLICKIARRIAGLTGPAPAIMCEGFKLRTKVTSQNVLAPVRVESALRYAVNTGRAGESLMPPCIMPGEAKGTATDDRLKAWGLWIPGSDHKRDAVRQCIMLVRRAKVDPAVRMSAWGS